MTDAADDQQRQADQPQQPTPKPTPMLVESIGGWRGLVDSGLPVVVFVVANAVAGLQAAIWAAIGAGVVLVGIRLARRQTVQQAISGFFGILIAAFIANRTGEAKGYFLFGIWASFLYAGVFLVSLLARWPLVGLIWEYVDGRGIGTAWRKDRPLMRVYLLCTLLWVLVFLARGLVQRYLYDQDAHRLAGVRPAGDGLPVHDRGAGRLGVRRPPGAQDRAAGHDTRGPARRRGGRAAAAAPGELTRQQLPLPQTSSAQVGLGVLDGHEQQLVARLQRLLRGRDDHPARRARSRPAPSPAAAACPRTGRPTTGAPFGRVISTRLAWPWRNVISRTRSPTATASSTSATITRGVDTATSTPQASVNSHSLSRVVDPGDHPADRELGLGQQRDDQVDLVVAGGRDHHVAVLQAGPPPARPARRRRPAATPPAATRPGSTFSGSRSMSITSCSLLDQLPGDGPADGAGPGDGDPHQCPSVRGALPAICSTASAMSSVTSRCTWSPSCSMVEPVGSMPRPNRVRNATRAPVAASSAAHLLADPALVQRHLQPATPRRTGRASPRRACRRAARDRNRFTVHGTVATVGMPSRSYTSARLGS